MPRVGLLAVALALMVGCVGVRPIMQDQPCPCAPGWRCDTASNMCVLGTGGAGGSFVPPSYAAADVQTALAQCDLPHGPVVSPATYGDKRALLIGAWIECPPTIDTVFDPALVIVADGSWQRLIDDGNGGLVPGYGVENQGMYSFPYPDNNATGGNPYVVLTTASNSFSMHDYSSSATTLETSPSRVHVSLTYVSDTYEVWLVRLPDAANPP